MSRRILRCLAAGLPMLGLCVIATDGAAEGVDSFRWPLAGAYHLGPGVDHDPTRCNLVTVTEGDKSYTICDDTQAVSEYRLNWRCGHDRVYDQHKGNDIYAPSDDLGIYAAAAGVVVSSIDEYGRGKLGNTDGHLFGNSVVLYHGDGVASIYAHMLQGSGLPVVGQWVECGERIGAQGSSGNSSNDHLHFEVRTGVTPGDGVLGGFAGKPNVDPFLSSTNAENEWCGASASLWVDQNDGEPSRTCDADDYIGRACADAAQGVDLVDGACVQGPSDAADQPCAWQRCVDGAWIVLPDTAALACTTVNHPHESCDAVDCASVASEAACAAWGGLCVWSSEGDQCVVKPLHSCDDGAHNGEETDIDCGGPTCAGCLGDPCIEQKDCASDYCGPEGSCEPPPFDCHGLDGDPFGCGNEADCVYHDCAASCALKTETACEAGCLDQCGSTGCVTGRASYYSSNNCISGPANGVAELYRHSGDMSVFAGNVDIELDGSFCLDLKVATTYTLRQNDLPGFACFEDYYVHCSLYDLSVGPTGVDGICADPSSCEDLGELAFDCGS